MNERIYLDILRAHTSASEALRKCDNRNRSTRLRAHVAIKALRQACELLRQASHLVSERVLCRAVTWRCGLPFKLQMRADLFRGLVAYPPAHLTHCSYPERARYLCAIGPWGRLRDLIAPESERYRFLFASFCVLQRVPLLWGKYV